MSWFTDLFKRKETSEFQRQFNRAIRSRQIGSNTPIYNPENPQRYVEEGYNKSLLVYSIVQWKARKCASINFKVVSIKANGEKEELKNHPVLELLTNPNPMQGKQEFFEQYYGFKFLTGNSYVWGAAPDNGVNAGKAKELYVLPAPLVEIVTGERYEPVSGYRIINGDTSEVLNTFEESEVLHSRYANYYFINGNEAYGVSPLLAGWATLLKTNSNVEARKSTYDNMGAFGMLIEKDDWQSYQEEERRRAQAQFDRKYKGQDKRGSIIYTGGEFDYIKFGSSPVDMQLLEDANASLRDLCILYHVDPRLFGIDSTYTNLAEARKVSFIDGVLPDVQDFVDEFNRWQMPKYGTNIKLEADTSAIKELQPDLEKLAGWLKDAHYLKENEKREMMGKEADPDLDIYMYPSSMIPLGQELPPLGSNVKDYKWGE